MNELVKKEDNIATTLVDIENTRKMSEALLKTPHYSKLGTDGIFAIVSKARSLNINPLEALNGGLYYVQGKVGMSSEMMASLIRQAGHSIVKDIKSDNNTCILHGKRSDNGDTWTIVFSMEDARRAGLAKNMYEKYPAVMLYNRAMSMLARQLFPDVIKGAGYTMDELKEISGHDSYQIKQTETILEEVSVISKDQVQELQELLAECSPQYHSAVMETLKRPAIGVDSIENLPANLFETILAMMGAPVKGFNKPRSDP